MFDESSRSCIFLFGYDNITDCKTLNLTCDCDTLVALNETEFEFAESESNKVIFNGKVLEIELNTSEEQPVICVNFTKNGTVYTTVFIYPLAYDIIAYVGSSLSLIGCALVLSTFILFKELRTLSTKILVNIVISIIMTDFLVMLTASRAINSSEFCQIVAILLHFAVLFQFMWMTAMAVEMTHTFYLAYRVVRVQPEKAQQKFIAYSITCWTVPLLIVGTSVIIDNTTTNLVNYGYSVNTEERSCWINHFYSAIIAYVVPISLLTFIQIVLFLVVGLLLCALRTRESVGERNTPYFRILFVLFFSTNMVWIVGFVALLIRNVWAWYPFIILFSIQGMVIFIGFFGTKKVLNLYLSILSKKIKSSSSTANILAKV